MYLTKQHFINCGEFLDYVSAWQIVKHEKLYRMLPTDVSSQTMKVVERAYRSFFGLLKKKQKGNYNRPVDEPGFQPKNGYFIIIFPIREGRCLEEFKIQIPKRYQSVFGLKKIVVPRPDYTKGCKLKEVRIIPKLKGGYFEIEWVYEEQFQIQPLNNRHVLSIDLGVDNFATCLDSQSGRPFILDGRFIKSYNRLVNKQIAHKMAVHERVGLKTSKNKNRLYLRRKNIINNALNQYVNLIVQYCLHNKIGCIVVGQGYLAQEGANLGQVNNQNFVQIPFGQFCFKLKSRGELYGIECETIPEPYTSKCDHLAGEEMAHHEKYLGKRIHRGLFRSSTGVLLNADVNGALGIMIRGSKHKVSVKRLVCRGCLTQPSRIVLGEIQERSAKNIVESLSAA
jgi:IS605 OrfB family transposase